MNCVSWMKLVNCLLATIVSLGFSLDLKRVHAVEATWSVPGSGAWNLAENWSGPIPREPGDIATFSSENPIEASNIGLTEPVTVGGIQFLNPSRITIRGDQPLTFMSPDSDNFITLAATAGSANLNVPIEIGAGQRVVADIGGSTLTFRRIIDGAGTMVKRGSGSLVVSAGAHQVGGALEVEEGIAHIEDIGLYGADHELVVGEAGKMIVRTGSRPARPGLTLAGGELQIDGVLTWMGPIHLENTSLVSMSTTGANAAVTLSGPITGHGGITLQSSSRNTMQILGENSYEGRTIIDLLSDSTFRGALDVRRPTGLGTAVGDSLIESGFVSVQSGTAEPFVVNPRGILSFSSVTEAYTGSIQLHGGLFQPDSGSSSADSPIQVRGNVTVVGRGRIGRSPFSTSATEFHGDVSGPGVLLLEGGIDRPYTFRGDVNPQGDVVIGDRARVIIDGRFAPAGDLLVQSGPTQLAATLGGDLRSFSNNLEVRNGRLVVDSNLELADLRLDVHHPVIRAPIVSQIVIEAGSSLRVNEDFHFLAGGFHGQLEGPANLVKRSAGNAEISRLGPSFDGEIVVQEGTLLVLDSDGLGSVIGPTRVSRENGAVLIVDDGVRVNDDLHLENASGIGFSGALIGTTRDPLQIADISGDVYLGAAGSYIGGSMPFAPQSGGDLQIHGSIHGGTLYKAAGQNSLILTSGAHTYHGDTVVLGGDIVLSGQGRLSDTRRIELRSALQQTTSAMGGLVLANTPDGYVNDRIADHIPVHAFQSRLRLDGSLDHTETVGQLIAEAGLVRIESSAQLTIDQLQWRPGAAVTFELLDPLARISLPNGALDDRILGGNLIAIVRNGNTRPDFATLGPQGVHAYADVYSYRSSLNGANEHDNVRLDQSTVLNGNHAVNALHIDGNLDLNLSQSVLNVESGGLLVQPGSVRIHNGAITAGGVTPQELTLHTFGSADVSAQISDNASSSVALHVVGSGEVALSGSNSYTGPTTVSSQARLTIRDRMAIPANNTVVVNGGTYVLNIPSSTPVAIERLEVREDGLVDGAAPIHAQSYLFESGVVNNNLRGTGTLTKRGPGRIQARLDAEWGGRIEIEQGILDLARLSQYPNIQPVEQQALVVHRDGQLTLGTGSSTTNMLLILDGGSMATGGTYTGLVEIRNQGTINARNFNGTVRGTGPLSFQSSSSFDPSRLDADFRQFEGNLQLRGLRFDVTGDNAAYRGTVEVAAQEVLVRDPNALGSGMTRVNTDGYMIAAVSSFAADLELAGGRLAPGLSGTSFSGTIHVTDDSIFEFPEDRFAENDVPSATLDGAVYLRSGVRLKKTGIGDLGINGALVAEGSVRLLAWEGGIDVNGPIVAGSENAMIDLQGNGQVRFQGSVHVPDGRSLEILNRGVAAPVAFAGDGQSLSGNGTIRNDISIADAAVVSPGDSVGAIRVIGNASLKNGSVYNWEIRDAGSPAAEPAGWDLLAVDGELRIDADMIDPVTVRILTEMDAPSTEGVLRFDPTRSYDWPIATADKIHGFLAAAWRIDATEFLAKNPKAMLGSFSLRASESQILLTYQPIPEPSTIYWISAVTLAWARFRGSARRNLWYGKSLHMG